jgi:hypothetical protein
MVQGATLIQFTSPLTLEMQHRELLRKTSLLEAFSDLIKQTANDCPDYSLLEMMRTNYASWTRQRTDTFYARELDQKAPHA